MLSMPALTAAVRACADHQVDPYEIRLATLVDLNGDGVISQDEKDYLKDLILAGKLKDISLLKDVRGCLVVVDGSRMQHALATRSALHWSRLVS
jgi:hypothetical protein